jgi:xylulose-5-phosphate/fructose-6-phosphate phosphoketolase
VHERFATVLARALAHVHAVQQRARRHDDREAGRPRWPVIVLRTPPGWTAPRVLRTGARTDPGRCARLEARLRSHRLEELFDTTGTPSAQVMAACPADDLRLGATATAGGGGPNRDLQLPPLEAHAVELPAPGRIRLTATHRLGPYLRDVDAAHRGHFRLTTTDAALGDQLGAVAEVRSDDTGQRWLEGYTRTGRHGLHAASEAFTTVGASQTIQHARWLEQAAELPWRPPVPSLNVLVTSSLGEPDGAHRGAGLVQQALGRRGSRVYLPPDANCLLAVTDRCLRSRSRVNLVLVDEQPGLQWLEMPDAVAHCAAGAGVWDWSGTDDDRDDPDIVLACAGDVVTTETVAAADILRRFLPHLRVRVVNVVDLWSLAPRGEHPHGSGLRRFAELFTDTVDVVFAVHGFPAAVHQVLHGRPDAARFRVRGAVAQVGSRTPFDVLVQNRVSRYHLVLDALAGARRVPRGAGALAEWCRRRLAAHDRHVVEHLEDLPEVQDWTLLLPPPEHPAIEEDLRLRRIAEE